MLRLFHSLKNMVAGSHHDPPISIRERDVNAESAPLDDRTEKFDSPDSARINQARIAHLESLDLPIQRKRVVDVGCGVGHLSQFFLRHGCEIVCLDARAENIAVLRQRYPNFETHIFNVEKDSLMTYGMFDLVFAYGLLYHLENPFAAIRQMASVCKELLLLETLVCDHYLPILRMQDEPLGFNQAVKGVGCRPSPSFVVMAMNRAGFPFVYGPKVPPDHPDFRFEWKSNFDWQRDGHLLRSVFIASRTSLKNPKLRSLL